LLNAIVNGKRQILLTFTQKHRNDTKPVMCLNKLPQKTDVQLRKLAFFPVSSAELSKSAVHVTFSLFIPLSPLSPHHLKKKQQTRKDKNYVFNLFQHSWTYQ
jgi:hypothetical protein